MVYNQPYYGSYYPQYQSGATPDILSQYKAPYQPMPMQQPIQAPIQTATPTSDMIFVLNEAEATSYPVAPNNSVILWDKNNDVVYIKSVNAQNIPSFRVLDYKERSVDNAPKAPEQHECTCKKDFVPIETFNALVEQIDVLRAKVDALALANKSKVKNKEDTENG